MTMDKAAIKTTQTWSLRIGLGFLAACVVHAGTGGWALAEGHIGKGLLYAFIMSCVAIAAAIMPAIALHVRNSGHAGQGAALLLAALVLQAGEGVGNMMAMGHTRDTSITLANVADQKAGDTRGSIAETERAIKTLESVEQSRLASAGWISTKPAPAWKAEISNLEGDKIFTRSKQCSNVTLPDSRAHCDKLTEARANLATAEAHERDAASLAALRTKLQELRAQAREDKPGMSAARTQSDNFVRLAGVVTGQWVQAASDEGRSKANFGVNVFMILLMMVGPAALITGGLIDWDAPSMKKPGVFAKLRAWLSGKPLPEPMRPHHSAPLIHDMTPTRLPSFGVSHESLGNLARIARRQVAA